MSEFPGILLLKTRIPTREDSRYREYNGLTFKLAACDCDVQKVSWSSKEEKVDADLRFSILSHLSSLALTLYA